MASSSLPPATPKRKRDDEPAYSSLQFSFDISHLSPPASEEPSTINTPPPSHSQSKVAHRFRGLALGGEGGGGVSPSPFSDADLEVARKRFRSGQATSDVHGATYRVSEADTIGKKATFGSEAALESREPQDAGSLQRSYPSINRLSESKSRGKRRSGTPPLRLRKGPVHDVTEDGDEDEEDEEMEIVDPVRASLTWHEHEITVYDPEDEDDDGTGINGIGFKPTPALAHARTMKRRQQMAEYKKREEAEAREGRSQRRRDLGNHGATAAAAAAEDLASVRASEEENERARRVRFSNIMEEDHTTQAVAT